MSNELIFTLGCITGILMMGVAEVIKLLVNKHLSKPRPQGWENGISDMLERNSPQPQENKK